MIYYIKNFQKLNFSAEFQPTGTASDDEETIAREEIESGIDEVRANKKKSNFLCHS